MSIPVFSGTKDDNLNAIIVFNSMQANIAFGGMLSNEKIQFNEL